MKLHCLPVLISCLLSLLVPDVLSARTTDVKAYEYQPENHVYQWSVSIKAPAESPDCYVREAYLWIPDDCRQLRGVVLSCHNAIEEGILDDALFRQGMAAIGFGELWITPNLDPQGLFDVERGALQAFQQIIDTLAILSGYDELRRIPFVPLSHSSQASQPWNFGAWLPERTLAIISYHGDSPRSTYLCCNHFNPDWGERNIDGIPALLCVGETEFNEFRIEEAFKFQQQYPRSLISFLCNAGRGHGDFSQDDIRYLVYYITRVAQMRLPDVIPAEGPVTMRKVERDEGWLADRWHKDAPPSATTNFYRSYGGNRDSTFWYLDEVMARWTESIYTRERAKQRQWIGVMQDGHILKPGELLHFDDNGHDMTVRLRLVYVDSTYSQLSDRHSIEPIFIKRFCGYVYIDNDSTLRLSAYRSARSRDDAPGLFIFSESDMKYGHAVEYLRWPSLAPRTDGKRQTIRFDQPADVPAGTSEIELRAKSDCCLPVQYYVVSGPAYIAEGNKLRFTSLPPRSRLPMRVIVRAWQPGRGISPLVQAADPVERTFFIRDGINH